VFELATPGFIFLSPSEIQIAQFKQYQKARLDSLAFRRFREGCQNGGGNSMKNIFSVFVIMFIFLTLVSSSFGQDTLSHMKRIYEYDNWPGKTGAIRQEPNLSLLRLPGFILMRKAVGEDGTLYQWGETQDKPRISATVKVYSTIGDAQMGLLNILSQFSRILPNTQTNNFTVGDIGFAINENNTIIFVAFLKNNITAVVKNIDIEHPISVKEVAMKIDSLI
jgi:hypothetical protein